MFFISISLVSAQEIDNDFIVEQNNETGSFSELQINIDSIEEYKQTKERYDFMCEQRLDLEDSSSKLKKVIQDMTKIMKEQFEKFLTEGSSGVTQPAPRPQAEDAE